MPSEPKTAKKSAEKPAASAAKQRASWVGKVAKSKAKATSAQPPARYDDLRAVFINCTLKPGSGKEPSHTERLVHVAAEVMRANGVAVDIVRAVDLDLAPGVQPDMTEHGAKRDETDSSRRRAQAACTIRSGLFHCASSSASRALAACRCASLTCP